VACHVTIILYKGSFLRVCIEFEFELSKGCSQPKCIKIKSAKQFSGHVLIVKLNVHILVI